MMKKILGQVEATPSNSLGPVGHLKTRERQTASGNYPRLKWDGLSKDQQKQLAQIAKGRLKPSTETTYPTLTRN